jgi:hypothetical protein
MEKKFTLTRMNPILKAFKALRDLGPKKVWFYAVYRVGLLTGHFRRQTPSKMSLFSGDPGLPSYKNFPKIGNAALKQLLSEADQIIGGTIPFFGAHQVPLELNIGSSNKHWTELERTAPKKDIKFIWEPGRFGWALTLARAYAFSGEDRYARAFWENTLTFLEAHPPNLGRQWQSAQEVAIRIMVLTFCDRVFANAPASTPERRRRLLSAIAEHAKRIPPTLVYARAQNNNHLLSEAAGLYTAGLYLSDYPESKKWRELGWRWIDWALQNQIDEFGTYVQHSTNYHRLMLQVALYIDHLRRISREDWPSTTRKRLASATRWLFALTDSETGLVPNLGANDSAYLFPLTHKPQNDYRPVLDAAGKAFLNRDFYQKSELTEMAEWFDLDSEDPFDEEQTHAPDMLCVSSEHGRAFIHSAQYSDRPSHADQLHVDLWHLGENLALDPGTYQYNAPPPWNNALATGYVHNTVTLDGRDQMSRAGQFLWLDWAQAEVVAHEIDAFGRIKRVTAEHYGFQKLGATHQRTLKSTGTGWIVEDVLLPFGKPDQTIHEARISWLLPDWEWVLESGNQLKLTGPRFSFQLKIEGVVKIDLYRAGESLLGKNGSNPTWGWFSPAYGIKQSALMVKAGVSGKLPINLQSIWQFE